MTPDNAPLVSVGMPVYNGQEYIRYALDAFLAQTYTNFELIISDNASTDSTEAICAEYARKDSRVRYFRNPVNVGSKNNFYKVFTIASGEYFMWASCHDLWEPVYISSCVEILQKYPSVILCYPGADVINADSGKCQILHCNVDTRGLDRMSRCHVVLWGLQYAYPLYGIIRTGVLKQAKLFEPTIGIDLILLFELSLLGEFAYIPEPLMHIRRMPDYGSWDHYIEKTFGRPIKGISRKMLFWGMLFGHFNAISRHIHKLFTRAVLMASVSFCILARYNWIRVGLAGNKK